MSWKDIKGYEGLYQINNFGKVKSLTRIINSSHNATRKIVSGYLRLSLCKYGIINYYSIHRLVANAFVSNPKRKPEVNHKDGNKLNNKASNLEWVTRYENIIHSYFIGIRKPTILTREQCHLSKVTTKQVIEILKLRNKKVKYKEISKKYGLSISGLEKLVQKNKKVYECIL